MNILYYDMGGYTSQDFRSFLESAGHHCKTIYYHFPDKFNDDFFCHRFTEYLKENNYDAVISVNFFPLVAMLCHQHHIKYISWSYDSPLEDRLADYFYYETNYIFLFDQLETSKYHAQGYDRIFHLPLAVNISRLDALKFTSTQANLYKADISFVGRLYHSSLDTLLKNANPHIQGYIEGILHAQMRVYGYYFIEDLIYDELLENINVSLGIPHSSDNALTSKGLSYAIASQITHLERTFLLEQMGELYDTRFYSTESFTFQNPVKSCEPVKYYTQMPGVFRYSKLNLCPTLRSIQSGIPLRALDIMGSGGVLLSNFQPELAEYFENEMDCIMYDSLEDAFVKADFYLKRDDLREQIAKNGHEKIRREFSYPQRIQQMFTIAGLV